MSKAKNEKKVKVVDMDKEVVNRHAYCLRCLERAQQHFNDAIGRLKNEAENARLDVDLMQMRVQVEHGMNMKKAAEEGLVEVGTVKKYSELEVAYMEKQKAVLHALNTSPQMKRAKAWSVLLDELEEQVAGELGIDPSNIDWKKGTAELSDAESYPAMKTKMDERFAQELARLEKGDAA